MEALKQRHLGVPQPANGKQGSWRGLPTGHLWDEIDFEEEVRHDVGEFWSGCTFFFDLK